MNKTLFSLLTAILSSLHIGAQTKCDTIPFILYGHLYLQATIMDSTHVNLIYDTGADYLYLDKDYIKLSEFGKRDFAYMNAQMGGAGNGDAQKVKVITNELKVDIGSISYHEKITPIINLREMLGRHTDGMVGNKAMFDHPYIVSFSDSCIVAVDSLTDQIKAGFTPVPANIEKRRILLEAELVLDSLQTVKGQFLMDMGSGGSVTLTDATRQNLNLDGKKQAEYYFSNYGFGGDGSEIEFRAKSFSMLTSLDNVVVSASQNAKGALSDRKYVGIIGNAILEQYDWIIDARHNKVYAKPNPHSDKDYQRSSTTGMSSIDRTDISDGWIVSCLINNWKAQQAGFEIDDTIIAINGRNVSDISWEECRKGLGLKGKTEYTVKKSDGSIVTYVLNIDEEIL